jgi:rhodanese-related sulfurtransferase
MAGRVDARTLKAWLRDGGELALLDVREAGEFGEAHLFHAIPLPYSRLEAELERLVPNAATRTVLVDDGNTGIATKATQRAAALGYTSLAILDGGTAAWKAAGYRLFAGVNVPSKAFGELVEHADRTPHISAVELRARVARGDRLVIVDGRPLAEYRKMNIPGGICCPNGELALRIGTIAPDPQTTIVVNCAGRTRSIIGAQTLIEIGVPNPVYALENGTQGWFLAGFALEHGGTRKYAGAISAAAAPRAAAFARQHGVIEIPAATAAEWLADARRTTYLLDVRTAEEFATGHLPGAQHAPGGQLMQATDQWVGVRNARILLVDSDGVRAPVAAAWLRRMGHDAHVFQGGIRAALAVPPRASAAEAVLPRLSLIAPHDLEERLRGGHVRAVVLRPSADYRREHIPGAVWAIRPRLAHAVDGYRGALALVADEPLIARAAALDLAELGFSDLCLLSGGFAAWRAAGLPTVSTPDRPPDAERIDYLFFVHDRHDGNAEAARRYLAWELGLLAQLDEDERATFRI